MHPLVLQLQLKGGQLSQIPGKLSDHKGNVIELSEAPSSILNPPQSCGVQPGSSGDTHSPEGPSTYRQAAVQAGSQPSYGKRTQLIADGLNDPRGHLMKAKSLQHPFDSISALKSDHAKALAKLAGDQQQLINQRFSHLDMIRKWKQELAGSPMKLNRTAAWAAKKLSTKTSTLVMEGLQDLLKIEDVDIPNICLQGLKHNRLPSPFFDDFGVPPTLSQLDFLRDSKQRSLKMIDRVKFIAEMEKLFGGDFQATPSFGLSQGDESGNRKFRRIDDHTASGVNPSAHRLQKVQYTHGNG